MNLAIAAIALVGLVQPQQQFGLVCTGTDHAGRSLTTPYSIDLDRGVWCIASECTPRSIHLVEPTMLHLTSGTRVNRSTGAWEIPFVGLTGTCTKAEFTPIPETAF